MIGVALGGLALLAVVAMATFRRRSVTLTLAVLAALCVPVIVWEQDRLLNEVVHPGIAPWTPRVYLASALLVAIWLLVPRRAPGSEWIPLLVVATLCTVTYSVWGGTSNQWAGVVTYAICWLAWVTSSRLADVDADALDRRVLVIGIVAIIGLQLVLCFLQVTTSFLGVESSDQGFSRARGTFGHAGDLGKAVVPMMALLLPFAGGSSQSLRRWAYGGVVAGVAALGLSLSRGNIAAAIALILTWTLLSSGRRFGRRSLGIAIGVMVASVPFVPSIVTRFSLDPEGGSRPELMQAALTQLQRTPIVGTGPNSYVDVVGTYDAVTARGLPVHNAFLLSVVELGVLFAALALTIGFWVVSRVWKARDDEYAGPYAIAFLSMVPPFFIIGMTGWGLLKAVLPFIWAFCAGLLYHQMRRELAARSGPRADSVLSENPDLGREKTFGGAPARES